MHRGLTWSCSRLTPSTCAGLSDSSGPCSTWSIANKPTGPRPGGQVQSRKQPVVGHVRRVRSQRGHHTQSARVMARQNARRWLGGG
jgi:hypothetical protein